VSLFLLEKQFSYSKGNDPVHEEHKIPPDTLKAFLRGLDSSIYKEKPYLASGATQQFQFGQIVEECNMFYNHGWRYSRKDYDVGKGPKKIAVRETAQKLGLLSLKTFQTKNSASATIEYKNKDNVREI
jgi:hypothetical protein